VRATCLRAERQLKGVGTSGVNMSVQNGQAFTEWLRTQLKVKRMSQRQLAASSGVDHSTISRLVSGDRIPTLETATKLARGLRELHDDRDAPHYLGMVAATATHPTARVEYALRADDLLSEPQLRHVMEYYLALRMGRMSVNGHGRRTEPVPKPKQTPGTGPFESLLALERDAIRRHSRR